MEDQLLKGVVKETEEDLMKGVLKELEKEEKEGNSKKQQKEEKHDQTVVIALDGSEHAEAAIIFYAEKIHRKGNKLVLVHCIELPEMKLEEDHSRNLNTAAGNLHMSPGVLSQLWAQEEKKSEALCAKMKQILTEKGLSGILRTSTGRPGQVICTIAQEENAAMIITGQRGLGKLRRTIMGSVSDYLVNHSPCPVVIFRNNSTSKHSAGNKLIKNSSKDSISRFFSLSRSGSQSTGVGSKTTQHNV